MPGVLSDARATVDQGTLGGALQGLIAGLVGELQNAREREGALMRAEVEGLLD